MTDVPANESVAPAKDAEDILAIAAGWLAEGESVALATVTQTWGSSPRPAGSRMAITRTGRIAGSVSGGCIEGAVADAAQEAMATHKSTQLDFGVTDERAWEVGLACGGKVTVFVEPVGRDDVARLIAAEAPSPRLILIGAVHIAQSLAPMARMVGFDVILVDPRRAFATAERFPGMTLLHDWPDEAMEALKPDISSAVVTLTHDPKLDDPALERALASDAFYIGALGSRKTHARRVERLSERGLAPAAIARIRGPVGLDLEAVTAPEIALSVIAEIVAVRRGGQAAIRAAA